MNFARPSADPPAVFLLDTNTIELAWRYGFGSGGEVDVLSAAVCLNRRGEPRLSADVLALDDLFTLARRGWPLFRVAPASLRELGRSNDDDADSILSWACELAGYAAPPDWEAERLSLLQAPVLHRHSKSPDAVLLAEVARLSCDALVTCDYRLHRRRNSLRALGPVVVRPSEAEDWLRGCGQPPWRHANVCAARRARADFLVDLAA